MKINNLSDLNDKLFKPNEIHLEHIRIEKEGKEYAAHSLQINSKTIQFRISKITAKKIGQFVSIWRRNALGITEAYTASNAPDFLLIMCIRDRQCGLFIFPKQVLFNKSIFSTAAKAGKRGIRIYPNWDKAENKQALKTQEWQSDYFIDISDSNTWPASKIKKIFYSN